MSTFDLFSSVRDGNTDIVRRLLQSKSCRARLNDRNEWGDTALHLAAEAGNGEICQMLTAAGASVTVRNNRGETCLHRAAVGGHVEAVSAIVGRDQDPDAVNSQNDAGYTSLHHAAKHGSKELIDILVKAGADQMIENNAGETPYMVAHKYQQWDAERLLLNVEQQHADKAIREMNRIEKNIVRGYLNAVKYASLLESRVRIVLVGDTGSGKSSLKKTLSGESYDPAEKPTTGINADPSVMRVTFKQFKEWVQQPSSKADTQRLNLEYIDVVIDYILYFVKQPQIVSDESLDPNALQIEKEQVKTVQFHPEEDLIPFFAWEEQEAALSGESGESSQGDSEGRGEGAQGPIEVGGATAQRGVGSGGWSEEEVAQSAGSEKGSGLGWIPNAGENQDLSSYHSSNSSFPSSSSPLLTPPRQVRSPSSLSPSPEIFDEPSSTISHLDVEEGQYFSNVNAEGEDDDFNDDDRLSRLAAEARSNSFTDSNLSSTAPSEPHTMVQRSSSQTSIDTSQAQTEPRSSRGAKVAAEPSSEGTGSSQAPPTGTESELQSSGKQMDSSSALIFNRTRRELSRLLIEKLPMEILKRMVIRWPVGEEHYQDRSSLNSKRLAMTIWDASGDPMQANYIPFFFSDRCLFVCTYNLLKDLDDPCVSYRKQNLAFVDGSVPTNAEVLESWVGTAMAFTKRTPSEVSKCTSKTPLLPPVILACTHSDHPSLADSPVLFHQFFNRPSYKSYCKHLVEAQSPSAVRLSNRYETLNTKSEVELDVPYSGHHLLRREIEYLARQLPYVRDNIPVQWVKFEQLMYGLQQQKKLMLLYDDLSRYIAEHCQLSGPLQVLPALSHFHDMGVIVHFYRHPELAALVITKPQWMISALASIITSTPSKWVTAEVQEGFRRLGLTGFIPKDMLLIAYRCARMGQKYWNEMLFILNCMDLITCHPALHETKAVYMPAMVVQVPSSPNVIQTNVDPLPVHLRTSEGSVFPIALFNQLVVRCIRSSQYNAVLHYRQAHIQLNSTHHLVLWLEEASVACLVQPNTNKFCDACCSKSARFDFKPECSSIAHLVGGDVELMPTDNLTSLIRNSPNSGIIPGISLAFSDDLTLEKVCPAVIHFLEEHLHFLCNCWFPGLDVDLTSRDSEGDVTVLDQFWKHTVLYEGKADSRLSLWFTR